MSKVSYGKNPSVQRTVKYAWIHKGQWRYGEAVCYEQTDEGAIASCYETVLPAKYSYRGFHITEIVTSYYYK